MVLAVLRDVIGRFEITRKEDLKVPPVGYFSFIFFPLVRSFLVPAEVYSRVSHMLKVVGYYRARECSKANNGIR